MSLIDGCEEIDSLDTFYGKADMYWKGVDSTLNGMLGGYMKISKADIKGSKQFLRHCSRDFGMKKTRALDCGAGIGRVSKLLLLPIFDKVDLVEQNPHFLHEAEQNYLRPDAAKVGHFFPIGLQSFEFTEKYDLIWVQWVVGHLTDEHFVEFLRKCKASLNEGGVIVIKDNYTVIGVDHDENDSSVTRTYDHCFRLFEKAGMTMVKSERQKDFPPELYQVHMIALV